MTVSDGTLEARELSLWRGDRHLLRALSFRANPGEAIHIRGPNGIGKTSLLRTLAGFLWPEDGAVYWRGRPVREDPDAFAADMAYLGHENALKLDLTPKENLRYGAGLRHRTSMDVVAAALARLGLHRESELPTRVLSQGQRRRAAMARVLLSQARLWLLDEPFTNLDMAGRTTVATLIEAHVAGGGTALLTAHTDLPLSGPVRALELG
jgi:heme exporter protein A